jgi:hypothetical protein
MLCAVVDKKIFFFKSFHCLSSYLLYNSWLIPSLPRNHLIRSEKVEDRSKEWGSALSADFV